jgi:hypothetical protein
MSSCPQCGSAIVKTTRAKKFCSTPCQSKAANARRATTRAGRVTSRAALASVALDPLGLPALRSAPLQPVDRATVTHIAPTVDRAVSALKAPPLTMRNGIAKVGDRVRIWIDSPVIGSGERHLLITAITKATVHLYSVAALREIAVSRSDFEMHAESYGSNPKIVLGLLETGLRSYARLGLDHDKPSAAALDALREAAR